MRTFAFRGFATGNRVNLSVVQGVGAGFAPVPASVPAWGQMAGPPVNTVAPRISGTAEVGGTLTTTDGTWSGTGTIAYARQWLRNGVEIAGATASTHVVGLADAGTEMQVRATATDETGSRSAVSSSVAILPSRTTSEGNLGQTVLRREVAVEDLYPSSDFTFNGNTGTWAASGLPAGLAIDTITGEVFGTPATLQAAAPATYTFTDTFGRQTSTSQSFIVGDVPDAFVASNLTITPDGAGGFSVTVNSLPAANNAAITDVQYLPPFGASVGVWTPAGSLSGFTLQGNGDGTASWGFRAVNGFGGTDTADAYVVDVTITGTAVAPTLDSVAITRNNDGTPADAALGYTGTVSGYRVYMATGTSGLSVTAAQLYARSGGTGVLEFTDFAIGPEAAITGLTAASNAATRMAFALIRQADGTAPSNVVVSADADIAAIAFAFPAMTWATNAAGTAIIGTVPTGALYFANDPADWTVGGVPGASVSAVAGNGTGTITLTLTGGTVANGATVRLSYTETDTNLRDQDGNLAANFSNVIVANTVPAASGFAVTVLPLAVSSTGTTSPSVNLDLSAYGAGDIVGIVYGPVQLSTAATLAGNAMTEVTDTAGQAGGRMTLYTRTLTGPGGASDAVAITLGTSSNAHLVAAFVIEGGVIAGTATDFLTTGNPLDATVTPTKASNVILGFTMGTTNGFGGGITWVNATEQRENSSAIPSRDVGEGYARANNVPVAALTVQANAGAGTDDRGLIVIAIEAA